MIWVSISLPISNGSFSVVISVKVLRLANSILRSLQFDSVSHFRTAFVAFLGLSSSIVLNFGPLISIWIFCVLRMFRGTSPELLLGNAF